MGPDRVISHSMRAGCATTLYANGVGPADIQRWGRCKSPAYMRYVRRENVRLHTLSHALTRRANLSDRLMAPGQKKRKVSFKTPYRCVCVCVCVWGGRERCETKDVKGSVGSPFDEAMGNFEREMRRITEEGKKRERER